MVNNAGIGGKDILLDTDSEEWKREIAIDLTAVIEGTQLAFRVMTSNPTSGAKGCKGIVINVASIAGLVPLGVDQVYTAVKSGVISFSQACAYRSKKSGIHVHAICPAFSDTAMVRIRKGLNKIDTKS